MALSLANAAQLKPQIKLAQALFEFETVLPDDQKTTLRAYHGQSPPSPSDVIKFTAEIDRDTKRNRKSRKCVGPRLTNVLHAVQQFSVVVDEVVGSSQSQIAGAIWGTVKISLKLASAISAYFDKLSILFMKIGRTCPAYQDIGLLYPESKRLQSALCEYFVIIVCLCKKAVLFSKKPFMSQISFSVLNPFESEFGSFEQDLENLANAIREEVSVASSQALQNVAKEMSMFREFARNFSDTSKQAVEEARARKKKEVELQFLSACSVYDHEKSWKQARKRGSTTWICHDDGYTQWKQEKVSSTLWCTGIIGSGKTVLSAYVVEDLKVTTSAPVAYFFCRHDEPESLKTRTIIGSIARQIFEHTRLSVGDEFTEIRPSTMDADRVLDSLQKLLPLNSSEYFIIIDGLDECEEKETRLLLQYLKHLLMSKRVFRVYCSSRPDIFYSAQTILKPQWNVSMSQTNVAIEEYITDTLEENLESGSLSIGDPIIILSIRDALLENAHGMFLWVVFQIDSICSQKTDEAILSTLGDLPKDLPDTFDRILRKLQHSSAADPQICKKIFDLVAVSQRPLTLEELREAVGVEPGKKLCDASKLVNDMFKLLVDCCGSLVVVDEEHLTVHFTHHSIKQHLLSQSPGSDLKMYHINTTEADLYLGEIIVTYLNFGTFDRQLTKTNSTSQPEVKVSPSSILRGSLPQSNVVNRLAVRLLKNRVSSELDIRSHLETAAGIVDESTEQARPGHPFLSYAQAYWLFHTKGFNPTRPAAFKLWQSLVDGDVNFIEMPWAPWKWNDFGDEYMTWVFQNNHQALINLSLLHVIKVVRNSSTLERHRVIAPLLKFLVQTPTDANVRETYLDAALCLASLQNNPSVLESSILERANVNFNGWGFGTALQVASICGHQEIVMLLVNNGADINKLGGGEHGTALHAAVYHGHEQIVRFLLKAGADVNAQNAFYGTALHIASFNGHEQIVRLLLENGANVNAHDGEVNALHAALSRGHEQVVRLLLTNGATVNKRNLEVASDSGNREIQDMIHNALKSQS
ncbi:hypothetical protein MMC07_001497 [Pseudocyphellaria aurata]|nr:hypothetical protein [Pseudocyphellaria aurata]